MENKQQPEFYFECSDCHTNEKMNDKDGKLIFERFNEESRWKDKMYLWTCPRCGSNKIYVKIKKGE